MNGKTIKDCYWNLPKDESKVDLYFKVISEEFTSTDTYAKNLHEDSNAD